jgi:riboflavin synthase alpha subunit
VLTISRNFIKSRKSFFTSGVCLTISRISVAQFFFTYSSESFKHAKAAGKISASTTISAKSTECLAI